MAVEFAVDLREEVGEHEKRYRKSFGRHRWNTLDIIEARRLKTLGIGIKLPRSADIELYDDKRIRKGDWIQVTSTQFVVDFVSDVDAVAPGGTIRIFTGEADPRVYNHPLVLEAMIRAVKPIEALLAHSRRAMNMVSLHRSQDAVYDFQYAEALTDRLGLAVTEVRKLKSDAKKSLQEPLGDMFGRFGFSLMAIGRYEEAKPRLEKALSYNPKQPYVNHNLGGCLRILGSENDLVAKYYKREIRINPKHPVAAQDLASLKAR